MSSGTVPISRRYMRTGSLIFSPTPGGQLQIEQFLGLFELLVELELRLFQDLDARDVEAGQHIFEVRTARQIAGQQLR